jgi:hypothetical protein
MHKYSSERDILIDSSLFEELEKEMGASWLIEKIFTRGDIKDVRNIRKYFGDEKIKEEVVKTQWWSKEELSFLSGIFNIPKENFLTYQLIHELKN